MTVISFRLRPEKFRRALICSRKLGHLSVAAYAKFLLMEQIQNPNSANKFPEAYHQYLVANTNQKASNEGGISNLPHLQVPDVEPENVS